MAERPLDPDALRYVRHWEPVLAPAARRVLAHRRVYEWAGRLARGLGRRLPPAWRARLAPPWTRGRELPELPRQSFREWWAERERRGVGS